MFHTTVRLNQGHLPPVVWASGVTANRQNPDEEAGQIRTTKDLTVSRPGRNDPCPCGSGTKYKRCCEFFDSSADTARIWVQLQATLTSQVLEWARQHHGTLLAEGLARYQSSSPGFTEHCLIHHLEGPDGIPMAQAFRHTSLRLDGHQAAWYDAQESAWLSIWQTIKCSPGRWRLVRDFLTGVERRVRDPLCTEVGNAPMHLARLVDFEGVVFFGAIHHTFVPRHRGQEVADRFLGQYPGPVSTQLLSKVSASLELIRLWEARLRDAPSFPGSLPSANVSLRDPDVVDGKGRDILDLLSIVGGPVATHWIADALACPQLDVELLGVALASFGATADPSAHTLRLAPETATRVLKDSVARGRLEPLLSRL